jgi:hypothetical protein
LSVAAAVDRCRVEVQSSALDGERDLLVGRLELAALAGLEVGGDEG